MAEENLTWETDVDWDNSTSSSGIVHESVSGTSFNDATQLRMGYSVRDPLYKSDLIYYFPLQESSGSSTGYDFSGNNRDGQYQNSPTLGSSGILGTNAYSSGTETGERLSAPNVSGTWDQITLFTWMKGVNPDNNKGLMGLKSKTVDSNDYYLLFWGSSRDGSSGTQFYVMNADNGASDDRPFAPHDSSWHLLVGTADYANGNYKLYLDGQLVDEPNLNTTDSFDMNGDPFGIGDLRDQGSWRGNSWNGSIWNMRLYSRILTETEIQNLYDIVTDTSTLTTDTKSFTEKLEPNITNLSYTLNGQSITIKIYGSPGTASEEMKTISLDGSTSYDLIWTDPHDVFSLEIQMDTTDITTTPTLNSITLTGDTSSARTIGWSTNTDWNNAQQTDGVVFEDTSNTDHNDTETVKRGYQIQSPVPASPYLYWPMHEDDGQTVNDLSGNNRTGTSEGASANEPGLIDTTSFEFNASNFTGVYHDRHEIPSGVNHWYDASDPNMQSDYSNGDTVTRWYDIISGADAQNSRYDEPLPSYETNVAGPSNNLPAIRFDKENIEADWQAYSQPNTFILAFHWDYEPQESYLWDGEQNDGRNILYDNKSDSHTMWADNATFHADQVQGDRIIAVIYDRSNSVFYDGLASTSTGDPGSYDAGAWMMGGRADGQQQNRMEGYWYEGMMAPERLSDTEIKEEIQRLSNKWDISILSETDSVRTT